MYQYTIVISTERPLELEGIESLNIELKAPESPSEEIIIRLDRYYNGGDYMGLEGGYVEEIEYMLYDGQLNYIQELYGIQDGDFDSFIEAHKREIAADLINSSLVNEDIHSEIERKTTAYIENLVEQGMLQGEIERCKAL